MSLICSPTKVAICLLFLLLLLLLLCYESLVGHVAHSIGWRHLKMGFMGCFWLFMYILVFYFSATRRDIDLKLIQDTYRVIINSLNNIDLHMLKVKVTGMVHCFLKVQSYHKH